MQDLAFLNAGAYSGGYSRQVDADYSGSLDIGDLTAIADDWGNSIFEDSTLIASDITSSADAGITSTTFLEKSILGLDNEVSFDHGIALDHTVGLTDGSTALSDTNYDNDSLGIGAALFESGYEKPQNIVPEDVI
jgi:hypothetical protein